jgi:predicted nucleotidyltransferase component of viral defense system
MLQTQTVEPGTLSLLRKLMQVSELKNFSLAGGTALALYFGHRKSIDLDLFSPIDFNPEDIASVLEKNFNGFTYRNTGNPIGLFGFIDNIKVDFVKLNHELLISKQSINDGVRIFGLPDLGAMKINAVLKRAVKKDFWDIAELLKKYSIQELINWYEKKYPSQQLLISIPQAITYFEDAEESEDPLSLKGQTWESVKKIIRQKVSDFLR